MYIVRPLVESIVGDLGSDSRRRDVRYRAAAAPGVCERHESVIGARLEPGSRDCGACRDRRRPRKDRTAAIDGVDVLATTGAIVGYVCRLCLRASVVEHGRLRLPRLDTLSFDGRVLLFAASGALLQWLARWVCAGTSSGGNGRQYIDERKRSLVIGRARYGALARRVDYCGNRARRRSGCGAGWLVRSFNNLITTDPGFSSQRSADIHPHVAGAQLPGPACGLYTGLANCWIASASLSGVVSAALHANFRSAAARTIIRVHLQGEPMDPHTSTVPDSVRSARHSFQDDGHQADSGRDFDDHDRQGTTPWPS